MNFIRLKLLKWIAKGMVKSNDHYKTNIIAYYKIMAQTTMEQFNSGSHYDIDWFLTKCYEKSIER